MPSVEALTANELPVALPSILATPSQPAGDNAVRSVLEYIDDARLSWRGWRVGPADRPIAAAVALLLPGRTALLLSAGPDASAADRPTIEPGAQAEALAEALRGLADANLHYVSALIDPSATATRGLIEAVGFTRLTRLEYLERGTTYPWVDPPPEDLVNWIAYHPDTRNRFEEVLAKTYQGSLDCPELAALRPIDDVLAAHQATGRFDPTLWELATTPEGDAGCLLLANIGRGRMLEVAYMGVAQAFRGRGLAKILLRRALAQARSRRIARLTLAVDARNTPAAQLYRSFGFALCGIREAYLYRDLTLA